LYFHDFFCSLRFFVCARVLQAVRLFLFVCARVSILSHFTIKHKKPLASHLESTWDTGKQKTSFLSFSIFKSFFILNFQFRRSQIKFSQDFF
jgi:hypothetical protein